MRQWKTLSRKTVLNNGKYLTVEHHEVEMPSGQTISQWPWLVTPDYVNILGLTEQGLFLCFRQTKYGIAGTSYAPAGGYIDPGEDPRSAAQREFLEETGYEASEWVKLGQYCVDGNRGAGTAHLYFARNARKVGPAKSDDLEEQELLFLTRNEVEAALARGEFKVLAWAAVVSLGLLFLDGRLAFNA